MGIKFNIEDTCDLEHYVVQINYTGEDDGWEDITKPFDTLEEATEWAKMISDYHTVTTAMPF